MTSLEELQDRYLAAMSASRAAVDDAEADLWKRLGESLIALIAYRMERSQEDGHPEWALTLNQGTTTVEPISIDCAVQIVRTPFGYVNSGRYQLKLGDEPPIMSHDQSRLRAALDGYLDRHNANQEIRDLFHPLLRG